MDNQIWLSHSESSSALPFFVLLRIALHRVLLIKLRRDVAALNAGNHRPLLAGYAKDAVLVFTEGDQSRARSPSCGSAAGRGP